MDQITLKTLPNLGTYFPPKIMCEGLWRYMVTVDDWHNAEHDAKAAHTLLARIAELEAECLKQLNRALTAEERLDALVRATR